MTARRPPKAPEYGVRRLVLRVDGAPAAAVNVQQRLERIARKGLGDKLAVLVARHAPWLEGRSFGSIRAPVDFELDGYDDETVGWLWAQRILNGLRADPPAEVAASEFVEHEPRPPALPARGTAHDHGDFRRQRTREVDAAAVLEEVLRLKRGARERRVTSGLPRVETAAWTRAFLSALTRSSWFTGGSRPSGDAFEAWLEAAMAEAMRTDEARPRGPHLAAEAAVWRRRVLAFFADDSQAEGPRSHREPGSRPVGASDADRERTRRRILAFGHAVATVEHDLAGLDVLECLHSMEALRVKPEDARPDLAIERHGVEVHRLALQAARGHEASDSAVRPRAATVLAEVIEAVLACLDMGDGALGADAAGRHPATADQGRRVTRALDSLVRSNAPWPRWLDPRALRTPWFIRGDGPTRTELSGILRFEATAAASLGPLERLRAMERIDVASLAELASRSPALAALAEGLETLLCAAIELADGHDGVGGQGTGFLATRQVDADLGHRVTRVLDVFIRSVEPWPLWLSPGCMDAGWVQEGRCPTFGEVADLLRLPESESLEGRLAQLGRGVLAVGSTRRGPEAWERQEVRRVEEVVYAASREVAEALAECVGRPAASVLPAASAGSEVQRGSVARLRAAISELGADERPWPPWLCPSVRRAPWLLRRERPTQDELRSVLRLGPGAVMPDTSADLLRSIERIERTDREATGVGEGELVERHGSSRAVELAARIDTVLRQGDADTAPALAPDPECAAPIVCEPLRMPGDAGGEAQARVAAHPWVHHGHGVPAPLAGWQITHAAGLALLRPFLSAACEDLFRTLETPDDEALQQLHRTWLLCFICSRDVPGSWGWDPMVRLLAGRQSDHATDALDVDPVPAPDPLQAERVTRVAGGVLRSFAGVVPGLESHAEAVLRSYFVLREGRIGPATPGGRKLELLRGDLDMLLARSDLPMGVGLLPWVGLLDVEIVSSLAPSSGLS